MDVVSKIGQLLLSLSILVFLHEWGHYITARIFKTRVEKFYLFFDFLFPFPNLAKFSIFKFKIKDTEWGLGWFPLGGYVKIAGMLDESADKEAMKLPPKPDEFRSKKAWQRLIIILGGIIVNLILGVLIFWMVKFVWGDKYIPFSQTTVAITDSTLIQAGFQSGDRIVDYEDMGALNTDIVFNGAKSIRVERNNEILDLALPETIVKDIIAHPKTSYFTPRMPFVVSKVPLSSENYSTGIQKGDRIVMLDTIPINYFDEFKPIASNYKGKIVDLKVDRGGEMVDLRVKINDEGILGVLASNPIELNKMGLMPITTVKYGFFEAFPVGFNRAVEIIVNYVKQFKLLFNPKTGAYKQVGGFGAMANTFSPTWDWEQFWTMTAIISLILAFMNFLPIPMLDGGYMMFILWEMLTGKPPGEKFMNIANTVGFIIVLALIVLANGNDIFKGIMGK